MRGERITQTRIIGAVIASVVVFAMASLSAWQSYSTSPYVEGRTLLYRIEHVVEAIETYKARHGAPPATLNDLSGGEQLTDNWNRPFHYTVTGDTYELASYGRDGEPGGVGYDADMTPQSSPEAHRPTYVQFLTDSYARNMVAVCLFGGLAACAIVLRRPRKSSSRRSRRRHPVMRLILPLLATLVITALIAALQVPSGH